MYKISQDKTSLTFNVTLIVIDTYDENGNEVILLLGIAMKSALERSIKTYGWHWHYRKGHIMK